VHYEGPANGSHDPDIEVRLNFTDYLALRDPVLEKIIEPEHG
jgi:hypothetical protein